MLTIVATPIGNLKDITLRSLEALQGADAIICEDTRRTSVLLKHYNITKPLVILNDFNEARNTRLIIKRLQEGQNLCLVSDAGTPLVSDPGYKLIRECLKQGVPVDSLPGPSSILPALTLSGLPPDKFMFLGYLPDKPGHRKDVYQQLIAIATQCVMTFIMFFPPFKIIKSFAEMKEHLGDIEITLAKELTKIHQNVRTQKISVWLEEFHKRPPKGEYVGLLRPRSLTT